MQAVPLVASAALGHLLFGDFQLDLTASLLIGALPGVYVGAKVSSSAPGGIVRRALVVVLLASALKLLEASNTSLVVVLAAVAVVGPLLWATVYRSARPDQADRGAEGPAPGRGDRPLAQLGRGRRAAESGAVTAYRADRIAGPGGVRRWPYVE